MKKSGRYIGVATASLADIVDDKKQGSGRLFINPAKHSWYIIKLYYWELNKKAIAFEEKKGKLCQSKNDLCHLHL